MSADIRSVWKGQLAQILVLPSVRNLPLASQTMAFQIAMRSRYRARNHGSPGYAHMIPRLQQWAPRSSSLLLVDGKNNPKGPIYFATDVVEAVSKTSIPVVWVLSKSRLDSANMLLTDVLRMLTVQALQIPRPSPTEETMISTSEIESTVTDEEWLVLLTRALSGLRQVYIVIDTGVLRNGSSERDQHRITRLADELLKQSRFRGLDLKIILVARKIVDLGKCGDMNSEMQPLRLSTDAADPSSGRLRGGVAHQPNRQKSRYHRLSRGIPTRSAIPIERVFSQALASDQEA